MTKDEVIRIMAMLGAFYSGGKNDPKAQAQAWYLILKDYEYSVAEKAVLNFARNDTRDYATFPTVGKIVSEIKNEQYKSKKQIQEVINSISYGKKYDALSDGAKTLISEELYNGWVAMDAEEFSLNANKFADFLKGNQKMLLGGE